MTTIRPAFYFNNYSTYRALAPSMPVRTNTAPGWGVDASNRIYRDKNGSRVYYTVREKIGDGVFSNVHRLQPNRPGLKDKAIKISKWSSFQREVATLSSIGGNFTGVLKKAKFGNNSVIVMSKYDTNLYEKIPQLTLQMQKSAIEQLISGVKTLHDKGIFHRDVTIHNVFYKKKGDKFELGDFGFSTIHYGEKRHDIIGFGVVLRSIILKSRIIPTNNPLRPLTEKDIPQGLPSWLAHLTNLAETKSRNINEVYNYYMEQTRLDHLCFFR